MAEPANSFEEIKINGISPLKEKLSSKEKKTKAAKLLLLLLVFFLLTLSIVFAYKIIKIQSSVPTMPASPTLSPIPLATKTPTPTPESGKFICPPGNTVDCMPTIGEEKWFCAKEFLDWANQNCPGFTVSY